jgi:ubiquinone/menaquinone biosynthesis C-methylase UbiE
MSINMKKTPEKPRSDFSFKFMAAMFKFRDLFRPRKNVVKEAGIKPGNSVLDFGCGPGGYIIPVSKLVGPSGIIYALDINPLALESVRKIAAQKKITNLITILSGHSTSLPDASIDVVLLYDVFHDLPNPDDILKELHRVLKPEGILSMSDHHMKREEIVSGITNGGLFRLSIKGKKVYNFIKA